MDKYFYYSFCTGIDRIGDYEFEIKLCRLARACNGAFGGAGFNGSLRDYGFTFKTEKSARKFNAALGRRAKAWNVSKRHLDFTLNDDITEIF